MKLMQIFVVYFKHNLYYMFGINLGTFKQIISNDNFSMLRDIKYFARELFVKWLIGIEN